MDTLLRILAFVAIVAIIGFAILEFYVFPKLDGYPGATVAPAVSEKSGAERRAP
jgi:hypothetical protein